MVEFADKELVIRIESDYPESNLYELQESLIYVMSSISNDFINRDPMYPLFEFLRSLLINTDQLKEFKEWKRKALQSDN